MEKINISTDEERRANEELINSLKELENEYKNSFLLKPENNKTDGEIKDWAKAQLSGGYDKGVENLIEKTDKKLQDAENRFYKQKNAFINRGLAHSSMFEDNFNSHGEFSAEEIKGLNEKHGLSYGALSAEIEIIQREFKNAINNFELKYASDLEKRVQTLERERNAELTAVQRENDRLLNEFYKTKNTPSSPQAQKENRELMYQKASAFYKGLNKDSALEMLYARYSELSLLMGSETAFRLVEETLKR